MAVASASPNSNSAGQPSGKPPAQNAKQNPNPPQATPLSVTKPSYIYSYSCNTPQNSEQDNLCIEREAAQQSKRQADWAERSFYLGVAGTVFIVLTLAASAVAARAAQKAAEIAERALIQKERAFVYPENVQSASHVDPETQSVWWSFKIVWRNSGTTPTRNLKIWTQKYLHKLHMPSNYEFERSDGRLIPTMLGPGATILGDAITVTGEELAQTQLKELHFYIWGWATYGDVFSQTQDHVTKFCYKVLTLGNPGMGVSQDNVVEFAFAHHPQHNCADDECKNREALALKRTI